MLAVGRGCRGVPSDVFLENCLAYPGLRYRGNKVECFSVKWKLAEIKFRASVLRGG